MNKADVSAAVVQLISFLSNHKIGLACAAELLGGPTAARRVRGLIADFSVPRPRLTRRMVRELAVLHRLLTLTDVADFDSPAAHFFALIDSADPVVSEICLLTEGLAVCLNDLNITSSGQDESFDAAA